MSVVATHRLMWYYLDTIKVLHRKELMMEDNIVFVNVNNKSIFDSFCPVFPREVTQYDYLVNPVMC